jgi:hypothetical protein
MANQNNVTKNKKSEQFKQKLATYLIETNKKSYPNLIWHYASTQEIDKIIRSVNP